MPSIVLTNPVAGTKVISGPVATNFSNLQTLLNGGLDGVNFSTAAALALGGLGLTLGTDANLYRSAADNLKTDDTFTAVAFVHGADGHTAQRAQSSSTWRTQSGSVVAVTDASGDLTITFPVAFNAAQVESVSVVTMNGDNAAVSFVTSVHARTTTQFKVRALDFAGAALASTSLRINWIAVGRV